MSKDVFSSDTFNLSVPSRGYATQVKSGSTILENVQDTDAFGRATVTSFANNLKTLRGYDSATGRLTSIQTGTIVTPKSIQDLEYKWRSNSTLYQRIDHRNTTSTSDDYTDTFSYDPLDRVTSQATSVGATRSLSFGYDAYGNLTGKTSSVSGDLNVSAYSYGVSGKPHRLSSVSIGGVSNTLTYDSNGSITKYDAVTGDDTDLTYDGQNRVTSISVGTLPTARDEFWYDPDGQRFLGKQSWQAGGTQQIATTVYLGSFEEVIPPSGGANDLVQRTDVTATVRHLRTHATGGAFSSRFEYAYRDHLGSVDALTDASGTLLNNKTSHDAFGGRREANWTSDISTASMHTILTNQIQRFTRGFTDHEQLNRTGFIHMNGRVYDPRIGRFVSADPIVQSPTHSQSYNRYSYTFNSPLSHIDPSGYGTADDPEPGTPTVPWWPNYSPIRFPPGYLALELRRPATMDKRPRPAPIPGDPSPVPEAPGGRNDSAVMGIDTLHVINEGAILILPGYDLLVCAFGEEECSNVDLVIGMVGIIPGAGKVAAVGGKILVKVIEKGALKAGRLGGEAHRATVARRAAELEAEGHTVTAGGGRLPERSVITPEGRRRFPDISTVDSNGRPYHENVGRSTKAGVPVARERRALEDIGRASGTEPGYTAYDQ
jgi:RHS repeat-associated protein